jgi:hypothetical protein
MVNNDNFVTALDIQPYEDEDKSVRDEEDIK